MDDDGYVHDEMEIQMAAQTLVLHRLFFSCDNCHWNSDFQEGENEDEIPSEIPESETHKLPGSTSGDRGQVLRGDGGEALEQITGEGTGSGPILPVDMNSFHDTISMAWNMGSFGSLDRLNDDIYLHINGFLDISSLKIFGALYPRFNRLASNVRFNCSSLPKLYTLIDTNRKLPNLKFAASSPRRMRMRRFSALVSSTTNT